MADLRGAEAKVSSQATHGFSKNCRQAVRLAGSRNRCMRREGFQAGLVASVLSRDEDRRLIGAPEPMLVAERGGEVAGNRIKAAALARPYGARLTV